MITYKFFLKEEQPDKIFTPGVSWGYSTGSELDLLAHIGKYFVIKVRGSADWSGRGVTEYFPTQYLLCKDISEKRGFHGLGNYFEVLEKLEPGKKWKKAKAELISKACHLDRMQGTNEQHS